MMNFVTFLCFCVLCALVQGQNPNDPTCPQFQSQYDGEDLVIDLPGACQMVVGVLDLSESCRLPFGHSSHSERKMHIPTVSYRTSMSTPVEVTTNPTERKMCPPFPVRYLGTRVVVDTEIGRCQIVLGVRSFRAMPVNRGLFPGFMGSVMVTRAVFEAPHRLL